jgi:hypothetical protein
MFRAAFFLLAVPVAAFALETDARVDVRGDGRFNTEANTTVTDARVDFEIRVGLVSVGGTYRMYDFGDGGYNPRGIDPAHHIKHRYVEGRSEGLFFRGGHFLSTFGRGLALRAFEDINLEYDTTLDGFIGEYSSDIVAATVLGGKVDERVTDIQSRRHRVRGARIGLRSGKLLSVGLSGVVRNTDRHDDEVALPDSLARFEDSVLGLDGEARLGPVSVTGEYAHRSGDRYNALERDEDGHGTYLSATLAAPWLTLLGEYKDYLRFEHALTNPPTCVREHIWILMNRVTHLMDLDDERGFLIEGTITPSEDLVATGGASEARKQAGELVHWEIFGQVEDLTPRWGIASLAGAWSREYIAGKYTQYVTGALDLEYQLGIWEVLEAQFEAQAAEEPSGETHESFLLALTVYPHPKVTLSCTGETTSEDGLDRDSWFFGEVRGSVRDDLEVSLGAGSERGGKKCTGGICFEEPEFTGVRLRFWFYL